MTSTQDLRVTCTVSATENGKAGIANTGGGPRLKSPTEGTEKTAEASIGNIVRARAERNAHEATRNTEAATVDIEEVPTADVVAAAVVVPTEEDGAAVAAVVEVVVVEAVAADTKRELRI